MSSIRKAFVDRERTSSGSHSDAALGRGVYIREALAAGCLLFTRETWGTLGHEDTSCQYVLQKKLKHIIPDCIFPVLVSMDLCNCTCSSKCSKTVWVHEDSVGKTSMHAWAPCPHFFSTFQKSCFNLICKIYFYEFRLDFIDEMSIIFQSYLK